MRKPDQPPETARPPLWTIAAVLCVMVVLVVLWRNRQATPSPATSSIQSAGGRFALDEPAAALRAYGGSASCRDCHAEEFAAWSGSHHALAERPPAAALEDAAFVPPRTFNHGSQQTALRKNSGRYEVVTAGLGGTNEVFPVQRVLAHDPLRQMLVAFPGGRLQATEAAWDPRSNEWFNVYGAEDRLPGEWGHWTGRGMNWNSMCATCHNTRVRKNYDAVADSYRTAMVENGVGCESCHGPLQAHNEWQAAHRGKGLKDPTLPQFTREQMFDTCAACHSRRAEITGDPKPGDRFLDHHLLSIVDDSAAFHADGQIAEEDYEVSAFMGSRMFHKGVRCQDCHDGHTMKTRLPGNMLCLSCHGPGATNAPSINPVAHSRHRVFGYATNGVLANLDLTRYKPAQIQETGGECVNCHMPQTPYMQRHWRHDHGFTIPDPLLTKQLGIPNACNRCHADKSADWSLKYVEQWYGDKMNRPYRQRAQTVARARLGDDAARGPLVQMLESDEIFYWRAVAASLLQRWSGDPAVTSALLRQLQNTNALVRQVVVQALGPRVQDGPGQVASAIETKLNDASRNVRIEAARQLAATLDTNSRAGSEYLHFLGHAADQPLGQLQAGLFQFQRGDPIRALPHFARAAAWDPGSAGIRHEYALALSQLGQTPQAVQQLEAAVRLQPDEAEFHFKLALALNETGESAHAKDELEAAVKCDPRHDRAWYNLGLARSGSGDELGALAALARAETLATTDPRIPYARATILARLGRFEQARTSARRALELNPHFDAATGLLRQLEAR